jgi:hypothetical protein
MTGGAAVERNRFFTGKPMEACDFVAEQSYFLSRHRLHNRLFHGWGVVCGLQVCPHPRPECRDSWVIVEPGIAIDCKGRELILAARESVPLVDDEEQPVTDASLVCIAYGEQDAKCVPLLYGCDPGRREAGRTREVPRLEVVRLDEVPEGCWGTPGGSPHGSGGHDVGAAGSCPPLDCLEPGCACGDRVPLAWVGPAAYAQSGERPARDLNDGGVRRIAPPRSYLTRVSEINWPHGGELSLSELNGLDRSLEVRFERPLRPADGDATGINAFTFAVQHGSLHGGLEFVRSLGPPSLTDDRCAATFRIDDDHFGDGPGNLAGSAVHVSLKCDLILDCHGSAVDGDHLRGRLPSGDGVEGGTFESWFRVAGEATGGGYR